MIKRTRFFIVLVAICSVRAGVANAQAQRDTVTGPPLDTGYVVYDDGPIQLPLGIGLRVPAYNRVDGLVLPWGPQIRLADGKVRIDPTVTYRSHIGALDPHIEATVMMTKRTAIEIAGGRSTFTNDAWIRSNLLNSLAALGLGSDARNYFRADRGIFTVTHTIGDDTLTIAPMIGVLHEYAWSTGSPRPDNTVPWSVFGRTDTLKIRRANPSIVRGHITSALAGVALKFDREQVLKADVDLFAERGFESPLEREGGFTQLTLDARASFPTFGTQSFSFRGHGVVTGEAAPPQRFAYLGGAGTLATVDLLALGGDRMMFVSGEYMVPLRAPLIPFAGAPVISLRYAAGSAGVRELPRFIQNIGIGVGVRLLKLEYHVDPNYRETSFTHRDAFSVGVSLSF